MDPFDTYARFYDLDYAGFDDDVQMVQQFALRCGSPVLELGCGTGRLLLPLAGAGFELTGVDASAAMLAIARQKLAAAGLSNRTTLLQQWMQELTIGMRFNLAFAAINSFLHVTDMDEQLAALARIRQHLNPEGLLLLDLFNPDLGRLLDARGQVVLDKVMVDPKTGDRVLKYRAQTVDQGLQTMHTTLILDAVDGEGRYGAGTYGQHKAAGRGHRIGDPRGRVAPQIAGDGLFGDQSRHGPGDEKGRYQAEQDMSGQVGSQAAHARLEHGDDVLGNGHGLPPLVVLHTHSDTGMRPIFKSLNIFNPNKKN